MFYLLDFRDFIWFRFGFYFLKILTYFLHYHRKDLSAVNSQILMTPLFNCIKMFLTDGVLD